jgi:branched-subunit amino acid transport protein
VTSTEIIIVLGMALVTFAIRYPVLALLGKFTLPPTVFRALKFVPPAVLTAIIVPSMLMPDGERIDLSLMNSYLIAGIIAGLVAWRSRNLLLTIVLGMLTLWGWRWLMSLLGA